jgi:hypothetical protein
LAFFFLFLRKSLPPQRGSIVSIIQYLVTSYQLLSYKVGKYCIKSSSPGRVVIYLSGLPFGILFGHLLYFMPIWCILWSFVLFLTVLVHRIDKNLATLISATMHSSQDARNVLKI